MPINSNLIVLYFPSYYFMRCKIKIITKLTNVLKHVIVFILEKKHVEVGENSKWNSRGN